MHPLAGILAATALAWGCVAGPAIAARPGATRSEFISAAARSGMMGMEASRLAIEVTKNAAVREFAYGMLHDHERMTEDLTRISAKRGIDMPAALDADRASALQALRDAPPQAFDAMYSGQMASEHGMMVELLQSNLLHDDVELAVFSSYNLPREREHRRQAAQLKEASTAAR